MKIVLLRSPGFLSPILRKIFGIKKEKKVKGNSVGALQAQRGVPAFQERLWPEWVSSSACFYYPVLYRTELTSILQKHLWSFALGPGVTDLEHGHWHPPFFWECSLTLVLFWSNVESSNFLKTDMEKLSNNYQRKTWFNSSIKFFEIYHALPIS